jgi:hypothetical protein
MQKSWSWLPLVLVASFAAQADGGPEQAAVARPAVPVRAQLKQQLRVHGAEITRLQQQVTAQESHSLQAAERLQERNREIVQLQRQLQALNGPRQQGASGH